MKAIRKRHQYNSKMDHIIEAETDETEAVPLMNRTESDASSSTVLTERTRIPAHYTAGAVANLCSATLGAGILALPFALYQAGLIWGGILLISSAWATTASINLLVEACDRYKFHLFVPRLKILRELAHNIFSFLHARNPRILEFFGLPA